tara:strand:- start:368 stop:736 length:369 start_codon:yes stop_codon:yes gene_type:complete
MADKAATANVKTVEKGDFKFDTGLPVPPMVRGARSSETADKLAAMPVGASFLEPVSVPETIKDEAEREKVFKENARTVSNRLSGAIRRFKKNNEGFEFAMRTVNDATAGTGVRVWRVEAAKA